jgi:hypothetical protein
MDSIASFAKLGSNPPVANYKLKWKLDSKKAVRDIMATCNATRYGEVNIMVGYEGLSIAAVWIGLRRHTKRRTTPPMQGCGAKL